MKKWFLALLCLLALAPPSLAEDYNSRAEFLYGTDFGAVGVVVGNKVYRLKADDSVTVARQNHDSLDFVLNHIDRKSGANDWKATYVAILAVLTYPGGHPRSIYFYRNDSTNWFRDYCQRCIAEAPSPLRKSLSGSVVPDIVAARATDHEENLDHIVPGYFDAQLQSDPEEDTWDIRDFWNSPADRPIACATGDVCDMKDYLLTFTPSGGHKGVMPIDWNMSVGKAVTLDLYTYSPTEDDMNKKHFHVVWQ